MQENSNNMSERKFLDELLADHTDDTRWYAGDLFGKVAVGGDPEDCYRLSLIYLDAFRAMGADDARRAACSFYLQKNLGAALEHGSYRARLRVGELSAGGICLAKDLAKAEAIFTELADDAGCPAEIRLAATIRLASIRLEQGSQGEAFNQITRACYTGNPVGHLNMGIALSRGIGCEADHAAAYGHFRDSYANGVEDAAFFLGICTMQGCGCEADPSQAQQYFMIAESLNYPGALNNAALCCLKSGSEAERTGAVEMLEAEIARNGSAVACYNLGILKTIGDVCEADEAAGRALLERSAAEGFPIAVQVLENGINTETQLMISTDPGYDFIAPDVTRE